MNKISHPNALAPNESMSDRFILEESPFRYVKEDFLQYVWRTKKFDSQNLLTTAAEPLQILSIGRLNRSNGPDFLEAKIKVGEVIFFGNIEIHIKSSDWLKHRHQSDRNFDTVILHVVLVEDEIIYHKDKSRIPCLELRTKIAPDLSKKYLKLLNEEAWVPCENHLHKVSDFQVNLWLDRLLVERLEQKTIEIEDLLNHYKQDWESVYFHFLAKSLGTKINSNAFAELAMSIPLTVLLKHQDNLEVLEALLFGQSSMLEQDFIDLYPKQLKKAYFFYQHKYNLRPIAHTYWKTARLRPANFPTIRIAQLAMLLHQTQHLFSSTLHASKLKELEKIFDIEASIYWQTHYVFDKESASRSKKIGSRTISTLIINAIVPFLFVYGKYKGERSYQDKALFFLEALSPEKNVIIDKWQAVGIDSKSSYQTQALLELKKSYCNHKNCLNCVIGHQVLNEK